MSLNDLILPNRLLADLYGTVLTDQPSGPSASKTKKTGIRFLGNNKKRTLIIVHNSEEIFLSDKDLQFLTKILEACKLTLADVAVLNLYRESVTIDQIQKELSPENVLMLGVKSEAIDLPFDFPPFKVQQHGGCMYVAAPELSAMNQNTAESRELKSGLWKCLKILFNILG